jgi:hypothetical protein
MARLGPKPDALVFYSSEAGDPLLCSRRVGSRSVLVYASDIYGKYGKEFLSRQATLSVIKALIDGLFSERPPSATLTETADGPSISIRGDYLGAPRAALADESGRIVAEEAFIRVAPGRFYAGFAPPRAGRHTALIEDRGRTVARVALYANTGISGVPSDSAAAAAAYRPPFWALLPGRSGWLLAFFASSLCVTLALRMKL